MIIRNLNDLSHLVRDVRTRQALTQAALAAKIGVSRKWLNDLETGKQTADLALVLRTLTVLGLELDVRPRTTGRGNIDIDLIVDGDSHGGGA